MKTVKLVNVAALLLLIILSQQFGMVAVVRGQSSTPSTMYSDHAVAILSGQDAITLTWLDSITGGSQSLQSYENVISTSLVPFNARMVLLDIGWQN